MKTLNMQFKTSEGKTRVLRLNYVNESLTPNVVQTNMAKIADLNLFSKDGVMFYHQPVSAKYVDRTETPIF